MGVATKPRFAAVFMMILAVCLSLGLPAEDVLDAVYDESEALPFEGVPLFSIAVRPMAAWTMQAPLSSLRFKLVAPSPITSLHVAVAEAHRSADTLISLALICILLC
jgi:hypothetical protein